MRGNCSGVPDHAASAASAVANPALPPVLVPTVTDFEYQPVLVLMSVLFTPAASTRISTSPAAGRGVGTSVRYSSLSTPPCPVRTTASIASAIAERPIRRFDEILWSR